MLPIDSAWAAWTVALGIGLLIGAERERRKGEGPARSPAGLRTFALAALLSAVSIETGGAVLLSVIAAGVMALTAVAYFRRTSDDPGLTTEFALIMTLLLGAYAMRAPIYAAGIGVVVAVLLAARMPMHEFVRKNVTPPEGRSALVSAAATPCDLAATAGPLHRSVRSDQSAEDLGGCDPDHGDQRGRAYRNSDVR